MLELQEALEAASKAANSLQEQLESAQQQAVQDATKAADAHALEIQKMQLEHAKLQVEHVQQGFVLLHCWKQLPMTHYVHDNLLTAQQAATLTVLQPLVNKLRK